MFHRFLNTQMPLFGFPFLGRSGGGLGEVLGKSFTNTSPLATPFCTAFPRDLGKWGGLFQNFIISKIAYISSILHLTSNIFCDSPNRIQFPTLALTDIRGEPREAVTEFRRDGCYWPRP